MFKVQKERGKEREWNENSHGLVGGERGGLEGGVGRL